MFPLSIKTSRASSSSLALSLPPLHLTRSSRRVKDQLDDLAKNGQECFLSACMDGQPLPWKDSQGGFSFFERFLIKSHFHAHSESGTCTCDIYRTS